MVDVYKSQPGWRMDRFQPHCLGHIDKCPIVPILKKQETIRGCQGKVCKTIVIKVSNRACHNAALKHDTVLSGRLPQESPFLPAVKRCTFPVFIRHEDVSIAVSAKVNKTHPSRQGRRSSNRSFPRNGRRCIDERYRDHVACLRCGWPDLLSKRVASLIAVSLT